MTIFRRCSEPMYNRIVEPVSLARGVLFFASFMPSLSGIAAMPIQSIASVGSQLPVILRTGKSDSAPVPQSGVG
jgi:hypothetical protein